MCDTCLPNWEPTTPRELADIDPVADAMDAKRYAREQDERRAAGLPEPTLAELAKGFGTHGCTVIGCEDIAVEGHVCAAHGKRVWA